MHVLVLAGGSSDERDVSLRSGRNVVEALQTAGHTASSYDPANTTGLEQAAEGCDVAFIALHGAGGEDGTIQLQLERLGLPYTGCDVASSELCFDKAKYRTLLQSHDLPVAAGTVVDRQAFWQSPLIGQPFVLKPSTGGSSIDTILVHDPSQLPRAAIEAVFARHPQLLLEALATGTEITVGILGDTALPIIEIIPPTGKNFDYENKYNGASQELCPPLHVSPADQQAAQALAEQIHRLCGCRDMSRTDMIVGQDGQLTVLETNTIPGLTSNSLLPKSAAVVGLTMPELCDRLVQLAIKHRTAAV